MFFFVLFRFFFSSGFRVLLKSLQSCESLILVYVISVLGLSFFFMYIIQTRYLIFLRNFFDYDYLARHPIIWQIYYQMGQIELPIHT